MIHEIDGPQRAYVEFYDGNSIASFIYKSIGYVSTKDNQAFKLVEAAIAEAKSLLPEDGIVIWRQKPESGTIAGKDHYCYCRFATSPPLPDSFWRKHERLEGNSYREII